ncbi:DUF1203 domain-containing protein (plasmid) [Streptomycetaceae bacterium NBC_01309]
MSKNHVVRAIDPDVVAQLRACDDAGFRRLVVTREDGGAPLRCCLRRSEPDERIMLVSYAPLRRWAAETGASPGAYDECGPVFVHAEVCPGPSSGTAYPLELHGERRVFRAYSADGRILGGTFLQDPGNPGSDVEGALDDVFADPEVALVHVRAVEFGCFLLEVRRADKHSAA